MTEFNPADPDVEKVFYDLSEWDFEQQAELAAALADSEIPHGWEGTELVVPEQFESNVDAVFADVEQRLNMLGKGVVYGDAEPADGDGGEGDGGESAPREIGADTELTEYDLSEWDELERSLVADSVEAAGIPFKWEELVLLVPTTDEARVDAILDEVESGEIIPVINDGPDGDTLPFESLNSFFLAGERLRKNARDADGLERLLDALKIADPNRPPAGLELKVWRQSCALAEQLADALTEELSVEEFNELDDPDGPAQEIASQLHDLLRPLI